MVTIPIYHERKYSCQFEYVYSSEHTSRNWCLSRRMILDKSSIRKKSAIFLSNFSAALSKNAYWTSLICFNLKLFRKQKCRCKTQCCVDFSSLVKCAGYVKSIKQRVLIVLSLLSFANTSNSRTVFKIHLKWSALTFSRKYKKLFFLDKYNNLFVLKIVFTTNYKKLFSFEKIVFLRQVHEVFSEKYKKSFLKQKISSFKRAEKRFFSFGGFGLFGKL